MTINFDDKKKFDSIAKIRDAKDDKGNEVFTKQEKADYFFDFAITGDTEKARDLAKLLIKIKDYKKIKKANLALVGELELEKQKNSTSYRVANKNFLVDSAIAWLKDLNRVGGSDLPTDKTAREAKIKEYEIEISKLHGEQGPKEKRIISLRAKKMNLEQEKVSMKGMLERWESIVKVLNIEKDPTAKITNINGEEKDLNDPNLSIKYKDYDNTVNDINNYDCNRGLFKKDADGNEDADKISANSSVLDAVKKANSFLEDIVQKRKLAPAFTSSPTYVGSSVDYHNGRRYNCKNNLISAYEEYGTSFLKVLRDIGIDNLKNAVDKSTPRNLSKPVLKEYAEDIIRFFNETELITGDIGNYEAYGDDYDNTKWTKIVDSWHEQLLTKKNNEYPYIPYPDYKKFFAFMKEVFPANLNSAKDRVTGLKSADYLDKPTNGSFLKPSDGKKGWDGLGIAGYQEDPKTALINAGITSTTSLIKYVSENPTDTLINKKLKEQIEHEPVSSSWDFKTLVKLWWDVFLPFMNDPDPDSNDYNFSVSDVTFEEHEMFQLRNELRYCKTMKSILTELNLLSQPDEFDSYLLEIANMATQGSWINPRDKITSQGDLSVLFFGDGKKDDLFEDVEKGKVWAGEYNYKNFGPSLSTLVNSSKTRLLAVESEITRINQQISLLDEKNAEEQNKINDYQDKINLLRSLGEDEQLPTEGKKDKFKEIYDKKDSRPEKKWYYYDEILRLDYLLKMIKEEVDASEFDSDFKAKETEINKIKDKVKEINDKIYDNWDSIKKGDKELTNSEVIIKIKKDGGERGVTLEKAKEGFEELQGQVLLTKIEKGALDTIKDAIEYPDKYKDIPVSTLNEATLTTLFGFDVDKTTKDKWAITLDTVVLTEANIKKFILDDYGKGKDGFNKLMAHLLENGDGLDGGNKDDYKDTAGGDDAKKSEAWKKLIGKGPKMVIETIVNHEFEDKKDTEKKEMEEKKDSNGQLLDKSKYFNFDAEGKGIKKYMYEKKIGKVHEFLTKEEDKKENNDDKTTPEGWKSWFLFGKDNILKPTVTYVGGFLVLVGITAAIFWENVSEWWNGPVEEEGKIGEGEEKENEE